MKYLHYFLCIGLLATAISCSKEEEEDTPVTPTVEPEKEAPIYPLIEEKNESFEVDPNVQYKYYGAELYTRESFMYGRFEAKMKMAYAPGCVNSMFLYYNDSYRGGDIVWNEIDIEVIGKYKSAFQSNIITGKAEAKVTSEKMYALANPIDSEYHVYRIDWTPNYVAWYLDDLLVRKTQVTNDNKAQVSALVKKQSLRFNLWASNSQSWVLKLNPNKLPIEQRIDYVKVYDYDTETNTFTEKWTDEFDSFNSSRWLKGNWGMELVTESPSNIVIENGEIVLKLTKEEVK
ncbi:MAG: family 16 glycosylhydrolase [Paludibacteraceae bacterium]|nr:family 16 glycosylhydrolase [Paludibacteraceae bacterium]